MIQTLLEDWARKFEIVGAVNDLNEPEEHAAAAQAWSDASDRIACFEPTNFADVVGQLRWLAFNLDEANEYDDSELLIRLARWIEKQVDLSSPWPVPRRPDWIRPFEV